MHNFMVEFILGYIITSYTICFCFMVQEMALHSLYLVKSARYTRVPGIEFNNKQCTRSFCSNRPLPTSTGQANYVPSTSIRLFASKPCAKQYWMRGGIVLRSTFCMACLLQPAKRRCMHCRELGVHNAKYCRNTPRYRHCGLPHETLGCPS